MWQADAMSDTTTAVRRVSTGLIVACILAFSACGDADSNEADATPQQVLTEAKKQLDETAGLHLSLTTKDLPDGVQGITEATGVATSAPAFEGTISIIFAGQSVEVPVIAVDGTVFAQIPLTVGWSDVDPADYGAPDPAGLVSPETGFSSLLAATEEPTKGDPVRGGADNNEILTEYTGTVPGAAMKLVIPSATGDSFDAAYSITDKGELREATLTGEFYADSGPMTYTVKFDDYGTTSEIVAPTNT
jgi:lipoprotein LprG